MRHRCEPRRRDPATDRSDVDDSSAPGLEEWHRGAGERDDAEEVRVEHAPPCFVFEVLGRSADTDTGVVHEPLETALADRRREAVDHSGDVVGLRDVEDHGADVAGVGCGEALTVGLAAHPCEHRPALGSEQDDVRLADARGGPSDQRRGHARSLRLEYCSFTHVGRWLSSPYFLTSITKTGYSDPSLTLGGGPPTRWPSDHGESR